MAMMARMRDLAPTFIITVGVLFVLFMIISDSNVLEIFGARTNNVGSVNGRDITYQEFSNLIERARENQKNQTGQDIDEENMDQFRDQVWDALVTQILTEQQIEKFGISVTDEEIKEIILGENPPEFLKRNFIDSTGNFNREMYENALYDPRNKEPLLQAEEAVRQQRLTEKLQSILFSSITVSEGELKRKFVDQNVKMSAEFAFLDINFLTDSLFKPSEEEMKKYFENNPEKYKVDNQVKLKYVLFPVQASEADSKYVKQTLDNVFTKAKDDTSFKSYVDIYSETPYSRDTTDIAGFPQSVANLIANANSGDLIGPVATPTGMALYKLIAKIKTDDSFVRAKHILIPFENDEEKAKTEANRIYDELIKGADFETFAKTFSKDPGSAANGGDLGWFAKGRMVKEFEEACFKGKVNEIQKPVRTTYGFHIIKVIGKISEKFVSEKITSAVKPSATTRDNIYNKANDFSYLSEKNGFEAEAKVANYTIQETTPFNEDVYSVPGIGYSKGIVNFSFENGLNTISSVFKVPQGYVVFMISEIIKPGIKKFDDVKAEVEAEVKKEKKLTKAVDVLKNAKNKISGDLTKSPAIDPLIRYNTANDFTLAGSIPGVGIDYGFSALAYNAKLNEVTDTYKGQRGAYLIKVTSRTNFDSTAYSIQRNTLRESILQEKKSSFFTQWLAKLKEDADITDKRYMFYGR